MKQFLLFILLISPVFLHAANPEVPIFERNRLVYFKTQFAGNLGLLSIGGGRTFFQQKVFIDFNYGYLPEQGNGSEVHTFAAKTAVYLFKSNRIKTGVYIGSSFAYSITENTYVKYPNHYPKSYYDIPNAFHANPFVGMSFPLYVTQNQGSALLFYAELGTSDYLIWNDVRNKNIHAKDIWNVCFGFVITLK